MICVLTAPAAAQEGVGTRVAEEFARPALEAFAQSTQALAAATAALCETPGEPALEATRKAFGEAVDGWGRISVLRFGPLAAESRFERLFFWPDVRGIGLKQVQKVLAQKDESAATAEGLAGKSVAAQGLPALEFTLFGSGSESLASGDDPFRCAYAAATAQNIANVAGEVRGGWVDGTDFASSFTAPAAEKDPYRSTAEVDGEIVKAADTAFQYIRAAELLPPLGDAPEDANGKRAPLWRSGLSFRLVDAQIAGVRDLLDAAGYRQALPAETSWVIDSIDFELDNAQRMLGGIAHAPQEAFADEDDRGRIAFANLALDHSGHLVAENLAAALGLVMGFNALDGD
jgi:predicted lipoprotein